MRRRVRVCSQACRRLHKSRGKAKIQMFPGKRPRAVRPQPSESPNNQKHAQSDSPCTCVWDSEAAWGVRAHPSSPDPLARPAAERCGGESSNLPGSPAPSPHPVRSKLQSFPNSPVPSP
ncbi:hypothetical protein U0070_019216 [Myodes glareolus]|uniref:Uncharacterized protein n=1 Tax=Myodes glareolus TaxID=447135 RepID=A0AAW0HIM8_MYOGA